MRKILSTIIALLSICPTQAQISSQKKSGIAETQYSSSNQDDIFIFSSSKNENNGELTATMSTGELASFNWLKFNETNLTFETHLSEANAINSTLSNLSNGLYRVEITGTTSMEIYKAWVINNWYEVSANIEECNCDFTKLQGDFNAPKLSYTDPSNGSELIISPTISVTWETDGNTISRNLNPEIYNPPAENTNYTLTISDNYDCSSSATVQYISIVPKANFSVSSMKGEAPLSVTFSNSSINADQYEWSFYRSTEELKEEFAKYGEISDSIQSTSASQSPQYTFDASGSYMVKLLAIKNSTETTCTDELRLENYIVADTSYIDAPNFFTPNGDGNNDNFLIKFSSMRSVEISIFNRWGKLIFQKSNNNVGQFDDYGTQFAWDGKIGNSIASPGVYYYVVEGIGRDDKKHAEQGFFHLFREK